MIISLSIVSSLPKLNRIHWFIGAFLLHLCLHAQPIEAPDEKLPTGPVHPAVDAADTEWSSWLEKYANWIESVDYRTRYAIVTEQAEKSGNRDPSYDWRLEARFRGLTSKQIKALDSGGVVATGREYVLGNKPEKPLDGVFVTSDLVLHAYNMMVADLVRGIEMQRAPKLRRSLEEMWEQMGYWSGSHGVRSELATSAIAHARRVIGTALLCLGSTVEFKDAEVERDCRAQMQLILEAAATELPNWLEPADGDFAAIDYTRMKPVGLYTENKTLSDLFRTVRWLQVVPFRAQRDRELIAFAVLAEIAESSRLTADENVQRQWLGLPNCMTVSGQAWLSDQVVSAMRAPGGSVDLQSVRANLDKKEQPIHANDNIRFNPKLSARTSLPPLLKILPAYLTADSLLFSEILQSKSPSRLPEGRMITAYLGDAAAFSELQQAGFSDATLAVIRKASAATTDAWSSDAKADASSSPYGDLTSFNSQLLHTLAALFLPPPEGAPAFLAGPAWRAKTRNTVLSAWAEKKHTWVLHEVEPKGYAAGRPPSPPPGMVEPNPEFFRRLAALTKKNIQWMEENRYLPSEILSTSDRFRAADCLSMARAIQELEMDTKGNPNGKIDSEIFLSKVSRQGIPPPHFPSDNEWPKLTAADFKEIRESALRSAEAILHGLDPESSRDEISHPPAFRRERWTTFLKCVQSLEKMSEKQLRNEDWSKDEQEYLTTGIWMDYYSVAYVGDNGERPDPQSVGPKVAPVASDPNTGLVLHVGTADMSEIYVRYPWKGSFFLYRGPITPYYEFPSPTRLNDQEWRAMLRSEKPPRQPEWFAPLRQ